MKATTIYLTEEQKQIFKEIKYLTDKPMNTVIQDILKEHLQNYLEDVKKTI
jgi:hypothetical protein